VAYRRRRPEETSLYMTLALNWRAFLATMEAETDGTGLPRFVLAEVDAFLRCGMLAHGFVRLACEACNEARLVAFSCKRRGVCPACIGRRMSVRAAHLVEKRSRAAGAFVGAEAACIAATNPGLAAVQQRGRGTPAGPSAVDHRPGLVGRRAWRVFLALVIGC
jgi:Transposase zinc-binding domain